MNGASDPEMWRLRADYINRFVLRLMKNLEQEYVLRLAAALIWERLVDEWTTCRCEGCL